MINNIGTDNFFKTETVADGQTYCSRSDFVSIRAFSLSFTLDFNSMSTVAHMFATKQYILSLRKITILGILNDCITTILESIYSTTFQLS